MMWTLIWNNNLELELFGYKENGYYGLGLYWDDDWSSTGTKKSGNWE